MAKAIFEKAQKYPLLGFSLAVIILFAPLFCMEYATDTYTISCVGMNAFADLMYHNGRLVAAAFFALFGRLHWSIEAFYYTSFLLSLVFASLAIWRLYHLLKNNTPPMISLFISFFTILNPIVIEYFLFIEKGFFLFGIFMSILALENYVKALRGQPWFILWSFLSLTVSAFVYQPLPGVFASFSVVFAVLYAKKLSTFLKNLGVAVGIYGLGCLCNVLFVKFIGKSIRAIGGIQLSNLLRGLFAYGIFPSSLLYISILSLLVFVCIKVSKHRDNKITRKTFGILFAECTFCFLSAVIVTIAPFLFITPEEVWLPFRILYPMSMCLGSIPLLFFYQPNVNPERKVESETKHVRSVLVLIIVLNVLFLQTMTVGRLINNSTDEKLCQTIGNQIDLYEQQTGNQITKIAIYHDLKITHRNPGVLAIGDGNVRAFSKSWSDVDHMCVILERQFIETPPDVFVYQEHFAGRNWNHYHLDQLVFIGDTLHLCVY